MRTARLVALAVARRTGLGADVQDEVRLAVGEACTRAVQRAAASAGPPVRVQIRLTDGPDWLEVDVVDLPADDSGPDLPGSRAGAHDGRDQQPVGDERTAELDEDDEVSLRLLHGLAPFVEVTAGAVRLVWDGSATPLPD